MAQRSGGSYTGPPRYPVPPRWGFSRSILWSPNSLEFKKPTWHKWLDTLPAVSRVLLTVLWVLAVSAIFAASGEGWRYVLLLLSRDQALPEITVALSDTLVVTAGIISVLSAIPTLLVGVLWVVRAQDVAVRQAGTAAGRTIRQTAVRLLVPGANAVLAGTVLAELEHVAAGRSVTTRPRPSPLLMVWWALWAVSEILFVATVISGFAAGVQAMANGVELHFFADLVTAGVAVTGVFFVRKIMALLEPADPNHLRYRQVVGVSGAAEPLARKPRVPGAVR